MNFTNSTKTDVKPASQFTVASVAADRKWVYLFREGNRSMRDLLGGKGAGVAEMANIGLPTPPGFTITTEACRAYLSQGPAWLPELWPQVRAALADVERDTGKKFGDPMNPLLVSVRSGARDSLPGMMDTVLNLGLNEATRAGLAAQATNARFALDAHRRFIQMFAKIVMAVPAERFEAELEARKAARGVSRDTDLDAEALLDLIGGFKSIVREVAGIDFPDEPLAQLQLAVQAVFGSWNNPRAVTMRNHEGIPHDLGTAVNVQAMVFGNLGWDSGTGVAFTRDPNTGERAFYGEYLANAQGEDVVAGIRTPTPIAKLADEQPGIYQQLVAIADQLESHYADMQDIEFTIERGRLYMLQTRAGKRTPQAAVKIAVDLANAGLIDHAEAVSRVQPEQVIQLLNPQFDVDAKAAALRDGRRLAVGLNASPGAASGAIVFTADRAVELGQTRPVILARPETCPDDVHGMLAAKGVLTARGGATSHAAVVARGLGLACVAGCEAVVIDDHNGTLTAAGRTLHELDIISIDGSTGEVFAGEIPTASASIEQQPELVSLLAWADKIRTLGVWANADYPRDAIRARAFGAEGIGLCRTEHMFFEPERLPIVRRMILNAETASPAYHAALAELLAIQKEDFKGLFRAMSGLPVVIRLLDPPLHEFLPKYEELLLEREAAKREGQSNEQLADLDRMLATVARMREANPMLGLRGCRLGLLYPAINEMQIRAILGAAIETRLEGFDPRPEIMVPLVGHANELALVREQVVAVARELMAETGETVEYRFGTMVEAPRAALTADQIARHAEFFSFGTNDLTQMVFGYSRDDAEGKFLLDYLERGILPTNPFQTLDQAGVGYLMKIACERGRIAKTDLKLGICGEHGGDPASIAFCHELGLNYVSCSPYRVPVARLAAARAALAAIDRAPSR